jgi:integrase
MGRTKAEGTLVKRGNGWYLVLMIDGKRHWRAVKSDLHKTVTRRDEAEGLRAVTAEAIRHDAAGISRNRVSLARTEELYLEHLPTYSKSKGRPHVDSDGRTRLAPRTLTANLRYIRTFTAWMQDHHRKTEAIEDIAKPHASGFMATLAGMQPSSYNRALMALRHVFNVLPYGTNPFAEIPQRTKSEVDNRATAKRPFSVEELAVMEQRAKGWIRPAMVLAFHSGLRLGDVVTLKWSEIDGAGYITRIQRKSSKAETLYCPEVLTALASWRAELGRGAGEYVFPEQASAYLGIGRKVDQTLPGKQFQRFLAKVCKFQTHDAAGAVVLGFHSLRASNATYGRRAGQTVAQVQKRLAHSSDATTAGYIQLRDDDIRRELRATHRPLALPGTTTVRDQGETADRDRLAELVRTTMPIAKVRRILAAL